MRHYNAGMANYCEYHTCGRGRRSCRLASAGRSRSEHVASVTCLGGGRVGGLPVVHICKNQTNVRKWTDFGS